MSARRVSSPPPFCPLNGASERQTKDKTSAVLKGRRPRPWSGRPPGSSTPSLLLKYTLSTSDWQSHGWSVNTFLGTLVRSRTHTNTRCVSVSSILLGARNLHHTLVGGKFHPAATATSLNARTKYSLAPWGRRSHCRPASCRRGPDKNRRRNLPDPLQHAPMC